ncbi:MAG: MAPEG family protein [Metallibacterium scheffleri]|uniref:MAPEG family protein n=1 Tax=Metallibacterium scheffleri TaxID=993689 RepID=UPI0026F069DF|nr:MAPEG family protein [Metallibacterium scheffleri]MCK9366392.1 MAPEG family protein [Metallibacterium scheffleri]
MPLITGFYAALATLLVLVLAARIVWLRNVRKIGLGDGGDPQLARAIRVHANAVEYLPLALLLLLVLELQHTAALWLNVFGIALIVARVLHAFGLSGSSGYSFGRGVGILLTWLVMLAMLGVALWHYLALQILLAH